MHYPFVLALLLLASFQGAGAEPDVELTELESLVFEQVNQYRVTSGLPPLQIDAGVVREARRHSAAMAAGRVSFGHDGFPERVRSAGIGYRAAAENVALNKGMREPAAHAVQRWIKSRGHRSNMKGDFNLTGVGVASSDDGTYYFTQIFLLS
jgi:uncharacterized protein YkwD